MSAAHPKYRLFESTGYLYPEPFPAFAASDDFDTLERGRWITMIGRTYAAVR
jgi:hypothetical protein